MHRRDHRRIELRAVRGSNPRPRRQLITGVNWSPGIVNPFRSLGYGRSLESLLAEQFAGPHEPVVVLVHLACPRVTYTDRGKSAIVMNSSGRMPTLCSLR